MGGFGPLSGKSFRDKDGNVIWLSSATENHIQGKHHISDPVIFIEDTLSEPAAILQSKWEPDTRIYFKAVGHLYKTVIVSWVNRRIKTAHLMRKIEGGDILWRTPNVSA